MRLVLFALLLAGCSSPAPHDEDPPKGYTRQDTGEVEEGPGPVFEDTGAADTAVAPSDTFIADTHVAPDTDSVDAATCKPKSSFEACVTSIPLSTACGTRPDGCGGTVTCEACPVQRRCVGSTADPGHCGCKAVLTLCTTPAGAGGRIWDCAAGETPLHPGAVLVPQPDGSIARWCIPSV